MSLADTKYVKLIGQHHPDAVVWDEHTTLVPRDRFPAAGEGAGRLVLVASGNYEGDPDPLQVGIERGGWPDDGARFTWSPDAGTTRYGWDEPSTVAHVEPFDDDAATIPRNGRLTMVEDKAGNLIAFSSYALTSAGASCRMYRRRPGESWAYLGELASPMSSISPLTGYMVGWNMNATAAVDEAGIVYLAIQRPRLYNDGVAKVSTQLDIYRADDEITSASDMARFATDVLATPVILEDSAGGIPHMAFAVGSGQALCLMATATTLVQYAGPVANMRKVTEIGATMAFPRAVYVGGYFIIAMHVDGSVRIVRLASATDAVDAAPSTEVMSASPTAALALWPDGDTLWLLIADPDVPVLFRSTDTGATWTAAPTQPWRKTGAELQALAGIAWRGRSVVIMDTPTATGFENCAASVDLGGWTTMPSPPNVGEDIEERWAPDACWLPVCDLIGSSRGGCTVTTGGSPVRTTLGPTALQVECGAGDTFQVARSGSAAGTSKHFRLRSRMEVTSAIGEVGHLLASATLSLLVRQTDTGIEVVDTVSSATKATVSASGVLDIILWLDAQNGKGHVWYREVDVSTVDARAYTRAWSGLLTTGSVTPAQHSVIGSNCTAILNGWDLTETPGAWDLAPSWPYGRPLSTGRSFATNGVMVSGRRGPAVAGETFTITSTSQYGAEFAAATEDAPNLGTRFEAVDDEDGAVAWRISTTPMRVAPIWLAFLETNAQTVHLDVHDGAAWVEGPAISVPYVIIGRAAGRTVRARATAASTAIVLGRDDLRGSWLSVDGVAYEIAGNDPGLIASLGVDGTQLTIRLVEEVSTPVDDATIAITPRRSVVAIPMSVEFGDIYGADAEISGFRLRLSGTAPPTERYWLKAAVGPADVLGFSYGLDSMRNLVPRQGSTESRGGMRARERFGPSDEVLTVSWQAAPDMLVKGTRGNRTQTPEYLTDAYGTVLYLGGTTLDTIRSYMDDNAATGRPVVFLETYRIAALYGFSSNNWGGGGLYTIDPEGWTTEHAGHGEEHVNDLIRGGTLQLRRVV